MAADDADDLYGLALDAFVPERDALAKRLRAEGDRAAADEVKALRKPSVAAWAVNQAVRSQPKAARALWDAGDALIAAQDELLGGSGDAAALRAAVEGERAAVDALVDAARGLLTSEGGDLGEATLERVRETLHAAAIDPEAREEVAAGRATRELAHTGMGAFGASVARPVAPRAPRAAATQEPARRPRRTARRRRRPTRRPRPPSGGARRRRGARRSGEPRPSGRRRAGRPPAAARTPSASCARPPVRSRRRSAPPIAPTRACVRRRRPPTRRTPRSRTRA